MNHTSVFVNLQTSISATRTAAKRAHLEGKKKHPFRIRSSIVCTQNEINLLLKNLLKGNDCLHEYISQMTGAPERILNCIFITESQAQQGLLLHKQKSGYIAAPFPPVSMKEAENDYAFALDLAILSEKASGMHIYLHKNIPLGDWHLEELLLMLALQLDPLSCELPPL